VVVCFKLQIPVFHPYMGEIPANIFWRDVSKWIRCWEIFLIWKKRRKLHRIFTDRVHAYLSLTPKSRSNSEAFPPSMNKTIAFNSKKNLIIKTCKFEITLVCCLVTCQHHFISTTWLPICCSFLVSVSTVSRSYPATILRNRSEYRCNKQVVTIITRHDPSGFG